LLTEADAAVATARRAARGEIGRLAIGFVGSATYSVLPELLRVFHARFPDVELVLYEMTSAHQHEALREGRIEVGFVRPAIPDDTLARRVIRREPLVAALPAGHRLAQRGGPIPLSALAGEPFILFPRDPRPSFGDLITGYCVAAGFSPRVVQETQEMQTAVSLVAAGIGVSLVPEAVQTLPRTGVAYRDLTDPPITELNIVHRRDHPSAVLRSFLELVEQASNGTAGESN
jgi:DNA-binding transcriptional LysR family regulator